MADQGPEIPTTGAAVHSLHPIIAHVHTGLETYRVNATVPTGDWNRVMLTLRSWPKNDPWDRTFHVGVGPAVLLHGTTPRTNFTVVRDITAYTALFTNGTFQVWSRLESYVGDGIILDVSLDFYMDTNAHHPAAKAVVTPITIGDIGGAGTYAWGNATFPATTPSKVTLELFTSGHTQDGEFWYQTGRTDVPTFRVYVDDQPVAYVEALPYVYALIGFDTPAVDQAWWTVPMATDAAGVHLVTGEIPPYRADLPAALAPLFTGHHLVRVVQETHAGYWPTSLNVLLD